MGHPPPQEQQPVHDPAQFAQAAAYSPPIQQQHPHQHQQYQQQPVYEPQQPAAYQGHAHAQPHAQPRAYAEPQGQVYAQGQNVHTQDWEHGICHCAPCSSCLLATCLPCMLFGRTTTRMNDPSMSSFKELNPECAIWCGINCFTGCSWIYTLLKRGEIRERYGIKGSGFGDCCVAYWCPCCALIQQDNEVKARTARGPITQGYQGHKEAMHVPGQQPPPAY